MPVNVTKHAVLQYRLRTGRQGQRDYEIIGMLHSVATRGEKVCRKPGNAWELQYQGLYIIAVFEGTSDITVVTCLGTKTYRNWSRKNEIIPRYRARRARSTDSRR